MKIVAHDADGCRIVGEAHGSPDAPPLLFLNSIGCDRTLWDEQVRGLSADFRCIVFDARGHGESDAPAAEYGLAQLGQDALGILDAAGADRAHVCGLSLGGLVAQWLAIHAPRRTASLVLANTSSRIGNVEGWETRRALVFAEGLAGIADMAVSRFFSESFRQAHPEPVAELRRRFVAASATGYAGCCAALRDADLTPQLSAIQAPTLVIGGELDVSTPPDQTAALAAAITGARHQVLRAAHLSNLEQADAFTAALRGHLEAS
ncbi:MAG TPA: 3-oxoadipate enol-lactonase [Phenylobacterium sp.]